MDTPIGLRPPPLWHGKTGMTTTETGAIEYTACNYRTFGARICVESAIYWQHFLFELSDSAI